MFNLFTLMFLYLFETTWIGQPKGPKENEPEEELNEPVAAVTEAKELIGLVLNGTLNMTHQQRLLSLLDEDSELVHQIGVTPEQLPDLVENNPIVAVSILLKLVHSQQNAEYFSVLVNMQISVHSIEVVNRLIRLVDLPLEFVHQYVSHFMSTCETINDKCMQQRLVRLFCVFLESLIRNKTINNKELFIEVKAFCAKFRYIREAANLFRMLKKMDADTA